MSLHCVSQVLRKCWVQSRYSIYSLLYEQINERGGYKSKNALIISKFLLVVYSFPDKKSSALFTISMLFHSSVEFAPLKEVKEVHLPEIIILAKDHVAGKFWREELVASQVKERVLGVQIQEVVVKGENSRIAYRSTDGWTMGRDQFRMSPCFLAWKTPKRGSLPLLLQLHVLWVVMDFNHASRARPRRPGDLVNGLGPENSPPQERWIFLKK